MISLIISIACVITLVCALSFVAVTLWGCGGASKNKNEYK